MSQIITKFIADNAVTNAKAAQLPANSIKGNNTGSPANASDLSIVQVQSLLSIPTASSPLPIGSGGTGNTAGTAVNISATSNNTLTTLSSLSLPTTQLSGTLQAAQFPALTGDVTTIAGSLASTLATVNSNVGSFGSSTSIPSFTVNAKGLVTAASGNVVIAPAGTLSGTTLNAAVVSSSLTSVGTIASGTWTGTTIAVANGGTGQTSYTDGQLLIGNTSGNTLTKTTLSAGANITITNGNGSIQIAASSSAAPAYNYTSQTTTYSAVINDYISASGASFTITLPTAVGQAGKSIIIQHGGTSLTQVYTINTTSSQTVGGIASGSYALYTNGEILNVISDGTNWQIYSHSANTSPVSAGTISVTATSAYVFTVTAANATVGATYTNNGQTFTVTTTITGTTTLTCSGTGTPTTSGTLTKASGTGDATITFSSRTITGVPVINGSATVNNVSWSRQGSVANIIYRINAPSAGTAGSGDYILFLPTGLVADITMITPFLTVIGLPQSGPAQSAAIETTAAIGINGSSYMMPLTAYAYSSNQIRMGGGLTFSSSVNWGSGVDPLSSANFGLYINIWVPITGWQP